MSHKTIKWSLLFFVCLLWSSKLWAASIVYVSLERPYFVIDRGTKAGFTEGAEVCVFGPVGEKIVCAPIVMAKKVRSAVLIDKEYIKKIEIGMVVKLVDTIAKETQSLENDQALKKDMEEKVEDPLLPFSIEIGYLISPILSIQHNEIEFDSTKELTRRESYWKTGKRTSYSLLGAGMSFHIPLSSRIRITPGFFYRSFSPIYIDTDGWATEENSYVTTSLTRQSYGAALDCYWLLKNWWYVGLGLGYDSSKITIKAERKDSASAGTIASVTSSASAMLVRINNRFEYSFGSFSAGSTISLNVGASGSETFSSTLNVLSSTDSSRNLEDDFKEALNHKMSSFGAEILIFAAYSI